MKFLLDLALSRFKSLSDYVSGLKALGKTRFSYFFIILGSLFQFLLTV